MTSEQRIQSEDVSVAAVFQDFYVVPDYQREYVWDTDEVEQLLGDIRSEQGSGDSLKAPEYFIGSIVVCPGAAGVLELIDGQQRMTTLFLTLCAIRDHLRASGESPSGTLALQIAASSTDAAGNEQFRYRLSLQYEDSGDALEQIAKEMSGGDDEVPTLSVRNIRNAYAVVRSFLTREFDADAVRARGFYGYLTNKVKLIRIRADDVAKALKIFETINDRGVGLNAMDLLKNLLFMKSNREAFEELKTTWKALQDTLFDIGEKPLRFLRYFIFSRYDVDVLREDEIYGWFSKNAAKCGYVVAPLAFGEELLAAAQCYRNFFRGRDQDGEKNRYLENMQFLGGKAARQHLILLLAGRHLAPELFRRLCAEVENLFFCYVITHEPTRDFERNFAAWAKDLRAVRTIAEFDAFVAKRFDPARVQLATRFRDAMLRLDALDLQKYRLQYVLAKLTQFVQLEALGETEGTKWLSGYAGAGNEIEHVYPQKPTAEAKAEFGGDGDVLVGSRLGNLLLIEKSINASLGNRPYSKKRGVYVTSQFLLTRAIAEKPSVGVRTKIDVAVEALDPFPLWNAAAVAARQLQLVALAHRVWRVPVPVATAS
ncbi:MAG: DUF262 domain-containing HNH endonuclease family protein [Planctomycetes bacterium]|nr:DUF262 domain-containing HNH endonuclease family protein [Planctomycetota bacterium]